jgi:hypothetical protein
LDYEGRNRNRKATSTQSPGRSRGKRKRAAGCQRLAAGQDELELGLERTDPARRGAGGGPLPVTASLMGYLVDALEHVYQVLGLEDAGGGDEVLGQLVLARIIEPVSKLDSARVLEEAGVAAASYRKVHSIARTTPTPSQCVNSLDERLDELSASRATAFATISLYDPPSRSSRAGHWREPRLRQGNRCRAWRGRRNCLRYWPERQRRADDLGAAGHYR